MQKNSKNGEKLTEVLKKIGLSEHESSVYYSSLSLGPTTVLALSRASGVRRTTVYSVIETLKRKGLMAGEVKGFKTIFVASNPDKLQQVLEERRDLLDKNLGALSTLYNLSADEGTLRYYEGLEAVKGVYDGVLEDIKIGDNYCVVADVEKWYNLDTKYFDNFLNRRAKMNIIMRVILTESEMARKSKQFERNFNQQIKILPAGTALTTSLIVTPQKVVIHQYNPPISAIVIQTKSAIQLHFELRNAIFHHF